MKIELPVFDTNIYSKYCLYSGHSPTLASKTNLSLFILEYIQEPVDISRLTDDAIIVQRLN